MHTYIMTKVISLSDDAYKTLKSLKNGKESFSEVVIRISANEKKKPIMSFAGKWKGKKSWENIYKEILEVRKKSKFREVRF
ncbi:MAG: hypothetical protein GF368_00800 [Candidatus Aenigmarchaeota archaeon]|nr:hypothetical protein [Candidatus Aenigmarchaeota archaeon]